MSRRSSHHSTIVLAQTFDVAIERLYAAIADPGERRQVWAAGDEMTLILDEADLHVGGRDVYRFGPANAPRFRGQSIYHDIVPACRIVSTDMVWEGTSRLLSVALTTLELASPGHGTRLKITSQLVWLDDGDAVEGADARCQTLIDNLASHLDGETRPGATPGIGARWRGRGAR